MDGVDSSGSVSVLPEPEQPARLSSATVPQMSLVIVPPCSAWHLTKASVHQTQEQTSQGSVNAA